MKKLILSTVLFSLLFISCKEEKSKEKETIKEKKEEVKPVPEKAKDVITRKRYKPTGSHTGTISVQSTDFKFVEDSLSGGTIVLDMNTIQNKDL